MKRDWRTRPDAFAELWPDLEALLLVNPRLEAKSLFADLQRRFTGRFAEGQLRTLQRRIKQWRAEHGPTKEVFEPSWALRLLLGKESLATLREMLRDVPDLELLYRGVREGLYFPQHSKC